jgi:hypothetical protein
MTAILAGAALHALPRDYRDYLAAHRRDADSVLDRKERLDPLTGLDTTG